MVEQDRYDQLKRALDQVLRYDLEKLRRESDIKRVELYNQLKTCQDLFEQDSVQELPEELMGALSFAFLLLGVTAVLNGEQTGQNSQYSQSEMELVTAPDKYRILDLLSPMELVQALKKDQSTVILVKEYRQASELPASIMDDASIRQDLKIYLIHKHQTRLKKIEDSFQSYITTYGLASYQQQIASVMIAKPLQVSGNPSSIEEPVIMQNISPAEPDLNAVKANPSETVTAAATDSQPSSTTQTDDHTLVVQPVAESEETVPLTPPDTKALRYISSDISSLYEADFITRFDIKMNQFPIEIYSPLEKRNYEIQKWEPGSHISTAEKNIPGMPGNKRSLYFLKEKKHLVFGEKTIRVAIEAVSWCHLKSFEQFGGDDRPATLEEFLALISKLVDQAELGNYLHVIGVASPTGWNASFTEQFKTNDIVRGYIHRFVSFCLIDAVSGEMYFNSDDNRISAYTEFFRLEFDREKVARVNAFITQRLEAVEYVVFEDAVKETAESAQIVNKVFYDLAARGKYRIRSLEGIGKVLQSKD
jgi:hypothetical protein